MALYLRETVTARGKVYRSLQKLPDKEKFWKKDRADVLSDDLCLSMSYERDKKSKVCKVRTRFKDGTVTTHTLMKPERNKK